MFADRLPLRNGPSPNGIEPWILRMSELAEISKGKGILSQWLTDKKISSRRFWNRKLPKCNFYSTYSCTILTLWACLPIRCVSDTVCGWQLVATWICRVVTRGDEWVSLSWSESKFFPTDHARNARRVASKSPCFTHDIVCNVTLCFLSNVFLKNSPGPVKELSRHN